MKSLADAHTWDVVERPKGTNIVSCKWVFKIKKNAAGEIDKYKAWLVACGFTQQYSVDYNETYAPVARLASLRLILAIAAHHNWDIDMFDFHSAFLNGKLDDDEVIFMELPPGYDTQECNLVAHLCVALYGSKQGMLKWYQQLWSTLKDLGFMHTVRCKTIAMSNLKPGHEVPCNQSWESHFALVGTNKVQALGYNFVPRVM